MAGGYLADRYSYGTLAPRIEDILKQDKNDHRPAAAGFGALSELLEVSE